MTGTLIDGELRLGQELEVQPGGLRTRVRGLQSHKKKLETVPAGTRTAVNLGGVAVEDLRRGQVLSAPTRLAADARASTRSCGWSRTHDPSGTTRRSAFTLARPRRWRA